MKLLHRNGDLQVNFKAPNGVVRVQVSDRTHQPFPAFASVQLKSRLNVRYMKKALVVHYAASVSGAPAKARSQLRRPVSCIAAKSVAMLSVVMARPA